MFFMFGCFFLDPCRAFENLCVYFTVHVPPRAFISGKKHPMGVYLWKETPSAVHAPPRAFISGKKHPRVFLLWQEHPGRLIYTHSPVWALQVGKLGRVPRLKTGALQTFELPGFKNLGNRSARFRNRAMDVLRANAKTPQSQATHTY